MANYMKTLNDYFKKIYCINLDKRIDRWKLAEPHFKDLGLDVERVPGYDGSALGLEFPPEIKEGAVGCSLSHLFTIKLAKQNNLENFLLLEDDVVFSHNVLPYRLVQSQHLCYYVLQLHKLDDRRIHLQI